MESENSERETTTTTTKQKQSHNNQRNKSQRCWLQRIYADKTSEDVTTSRASRQYTNEKRPQKPKPTQTNGCANVLFCLLCAHSHCMCVCWLVRVAAGAFCVAWNPKRIFGVIAFYSFFFSPTDSLEFRIRLVSNKKKKNEKGDPLSRYPRDDQFKCHFERQERKLFSH